MGESIALFLINAGLNASFWYIGFKYDPQGVIIDLKYVAGALSWIYGDALYSKSVHIIASTWKIAIIALAFLTTPYCVIRQLSNEKYAFQTERRSMAKGRKTQDAAPSHSLKPLVFPCRTTHTRMFPKKHTFSYSYLFVGIPVGWHGSLGSLLSADLEGCHTETEKIKLSQLQQHSWFHVEAADYLERGRHDLGLKGKLDMYLKSQVCSLQYLCSVARLKAITERRSRGLCSCLPHYCTKVPWVFFQPGVVLVSVYRAKGAESDDTRSEQYV